MLLTPGRVLLHVPATSADDVIRRLATLLEDEGAVRSSFTEAVLERERTHPTGLPLAGELHVAIPHADPCHVLAPALAVATLERPVSFRNMADPDEDVPVSVVILMALNDPAAQVEMLQHLASLFQDVDRVREIHDAHSAEELLDRFGLRM